MRAGSITLAVLLDVGASTDARNDQGQTLLMVAAKEGATECAMALLARVGDEVNAQDDDGFTALHLAAYHGHHQVVSFLVHAGADPTLVRVRSHHQ